MAYPSFSELAHHLVRLHSPKDSEVAARLDEVRLAFGELIDRVAPHVPQGADATHAARAVHRACQDVIASIVLNQED